MKRKLIEDEIRATKGDDNVGGSNSNFGTKGNKVHPSNGQQVAPNNVRR